MSYMDYLPVRKDSEIREDLIRLSERFFSLNPDRAEAEIEQFEKDRQELRDELDRSVEYMLNLC